MTRVVALVAARNEAGRAPAAVAAIRRLPDVDEVVLVDDASKDGTPEEARAAGARALVAPRHLGKGRALEAALDLVPPADVYLLLDADLGETAGEAGPLLDEVLRGGADLAIGALPRDPRHGGFRIVKRLSAALIRLLGGFDAAEPMSGQRALTRQALDTVRPLARGFGLETAMTIDAARFGLRITEVPVAMAHRPTGRDLRGFLHRAAQGRDLLAAAAVRAIGLR